MPKLFMKKSKKAEEKPFEVEEGTGKTELAEMDTKKKKKIGKITYRKSGKPSKANRGDAMGDTNDAGEELTERMRLEYAKKMNRMLKNMK